jgi:hypothetical protein
MAYDDVSTGAGGRQGTNRHQPQPVRCRTARGLARMTIFFNISFLNFVKIYGPQKICKTRHLAPLGWWQGPTAAPHGGTNARGTVAPATAVGHDSRSPVCF